MDSSISAFSSSYKCPRCGKTGHKEKFCPTIGDPAFDPYIGLANVPKAGRKKVSSLEGIDISQNTVIEHKDGTYELFESSSTGRDMLKRDADTHLNTNIDLSIVPSTLKCAFSNNLLKDAVSLPCCKKIVSDSVIRLELIRSSLLCPLCQTSGISPDSLIICKDIRDAVESYTQNYGKTSSVPIEKPSVVPAPPSHPPQVVQAKPPPPPTTERPVVPPAVNTIVSSDFNALSLNATQMPATFAGHHPMHLGMMMGQPMMFPSAGGLLSNPLDEIPPLEALPLPLSKEEFFYEQQLQIEIMKERGFYYRGGYQGRGRGGYQGRGGGYYGRGGYQGRSDYGRGRGRGRWNQYRDDYERSDKYNYEPRDNEEVQDKSERSDIYEKHSDTRDRYKGYEEDNRRERRYEEDSRYTKYSSRNRSPDRKSIIDHKHSYHEYDRHHNVERNYRERSGSKERIKHSRVSDSREQPIDRHDDDKHYKQRRDRSVSKDRVKPSRSERDTRRSSRDEIENIKDSNREEIDYDKYGSKRKREEVADLNEKPKEKISRSHKEEHSSDHNRHKEREYTNRVKDDYQKDREKDDYYKDREKDNYREKDRNHKDREKDRNHKDREKDNYDKHRDKDREKDNYQKDRDREKDSYQKDREKERSHKDREKDNYVDKHRSNKDRKQSDREIVNYEKDLIHKEKERSTKDRERSYKDEKEKISDRDIKGKHRSNKSDYDEEEVVDKSNYDDSIKYQDSQHKTTIIPPLKSSRSNVLTSSTILSSQNSQLQSNINNNSSSKNKRIIVVNDTNSYDNKRRK